MRNLLIGTTSRGLSWSLGLLDHWRVILGSFSGSCCRFLEKVTLKSSTGRAISSRLFLCYFRLASEALHYLLEKWHDVEASKSIGHESESSYLVLNFTNAANKVQTCE